MWRQEKRNGALIMRTDESVMPLIFNHTANYPFVLPHITYSRDGESFLIYQRNSCWVIISCILMTSLTEKALILQREI